MLRIVKLNSELRLANERKKELSEKEASFISRENQLRDALNEATTQDDINTVNGELETYENDKTAYDNEVNELDEKIRGIETQIQELQDNAPDETDKSDSKKRTQNITIMEVRDNMRKIKTRNNPFGQSRDERQAYLARTEIKDFYERLLDISKEKRSANGAELGIPEIMMGYFRDSIADYSILLNRVSLRNLRGDGKAIIAGNIPEAVWTECCANINELNIDFTAMYVYCHKVAGYIPVCNATLEDFGGVDGIPTLASEIEYNLLKSIGLALDKAIIYGDGINMPLGFASSLPMTANPMKSTVTWKAHADNVQGVTGSGQTLFKNIMKVIANVDDHGASSEMTFAMAKKTWLKYVAPESLAVNNAGTIVAAANNSFPIIGGDVVFLPFIPDGDIVGGYLDNYILSERAGISMQMSEHVLFLQDNTVFKATARYDGSPIVPFRDSFFAINVNNATPATTATFPPDTANSTEVEG